MFQKHPFVTFHFLAFSFLSLSLLASDKKELKIDDTFSKNLFDEIHKDSKKQNFAKPKEQNKAYLNLKQDSMKNLDSSLEKLDIKK